VNSKVAELNAAASRSLFLAQAGVTSVLQSWSGAAVQLSSENAIRTLELGADDPILGPGVADRVNAVAELNGIPATYLLAML
jgi:hypothetical protein